MAAAKNPAQGLEDSRYGRFGLMLGIGVAVGLHLLIFAFPSFKGEEKAEKEVERGMVARAYRPMAVPIQGAGSGASRPAQPAAAKAPEAKTADAPPPNARPTRIEETSTADFAPNPNAASRAYESPSAAASSAPAASDAYRSDGTSQSAETSTGVGTGQGEGSVPGPGSGDGAPGAGKGQAGSDWDRVMSMLADKKSEIQTRETTLREVRQKQVEAVVKPKKVEAKKVEEDEALLDSRIRMSVVSYPPTAVEKKFQPVTYPDLRLKRSQLEAGICRVYLRFWVSDAGKVVRSEVKTPSDAASQEKYEPFITAVKNSVATWYFEPVEAQVHVDVLFEIK